MLVLGCRTPKLDEGTETVDEPSLDSAPQRRSSARPPVQPVQPVQPALPTRMEPDAAPPQKADQAKPPEGVRTRRHVPSWTSKSVVPHLPASESTKAKLTVARARTFELDIQSRWYPLKERCTRAVSQRLIDAWGRSMDIDCKMEAGGLVIRSAGPDGIFFSADDLWWIGNPTLMVDDR